METNWFGFIATCLLFVLLLLLLLYVIYFVLSWNYILEMQFRPLIKHLTSDRLALLFISAFIVFIAYILNTR
jgi:hypothetical protein